MRIRKLLATLGAAALLTGAGLATAQAASAHEKDYIIAAWEMPTWSGPQTATWPQKLLTSETTDETNLDALDADLKCGSFYQIDIYHNNDEARALIKKGTLENSGEDGNVLIGGGWGTAYKLVKTRECTPVHPTQPTVESGVSTCIDGESVPGNGTVTLPPFEHGYWTDADGNTVSGTIENVAPGKHTYTAVADEGYRIDGSADFTADVPESLPIDCTATPTQPTAEAGTPTCVDGISVPGNGTVTLAAFEHGHWTDGDGNTVSGTIKDVTPGDHLYTAVADGGYRIDGETKADFTVTVPNGTPADCALPVTPTEPPVQPAADTHKLASTGSDVSLGWIAGGIAAFGAGLILVGGAYLRRRFQH